MKIEIIDWYDHTAFQENHWRDLEEVADLEPILISTVGWVVHETDEYVTVISTKGNNDRVCGDMLILKGTIVNRWEVEQ